MNRMKSATLAIASLLLITMNAAFAQAAGGGLGDTLVQYFYTNFVHAIAAAGLLFVLVGLVFARSHMLMFVGIGIALLAIGNYQTILGLFNL